MEKRKRIYVPETVYLELKGLADAKGINVDDLANQLLEKEMIKR